ncbi:MAG: hypothetical protein U0T69_11365 [Chitinophagales bacterium]
MAKFIIEIPDENFKGTTTKDRIDELYRRIDTRFNNVEISDYDENIMLISAEQQFTGFDHGKQDYDIISLVEFMTQEEINNAKILIAEFDLGENWRDITIDFVNRNSEFLFDDQKPIDVDDLEYDSSWNALMPVVEKICRLKIGDGVETVDYCFPRTFGMLNVHPSSSFDTEIPDGKIMVRLNGHQLFKADTLIEATFLAVVDFIKCYNENKK